MYIEIKSIIPKNPNSRAYIQFYYKGKRFREYNGKSLGKEINPNRQNTLKQKETAIKKLNYEFTRAFENGWFPDKIETVHIIETITIEEALKSVLQSKLTNKLSNSYIVDLKKVYEQFMIYLSLNLPNAPLESIIKVDFDDFLISFKSSATYYMNKRRTLGVLMSELVRKRLIPYNPIKETNKQKVSATLHEIYTKTEIVAVLNFLKESYPNLHLCCLLAYGCFLRPHQEARLLQLKNFNKDLTKIKLSGSENKGKKIRVINIPDYVQKELITISSSIKDEEYNIFSKKKTAYNVCYFNTQWSRAKNKMEKLGIIKKHQTIYSFRHTAAVNVYRKTKDLNILQQLLGHSDMLVTLKYLRGLGEATNEELRDVMPTL